MSVSSNLYLNPKVEPDEIKTVIEQYLGMEVKVKSQDKISVGYFWFALKKGGEEYVVINVHSKAQCPIGACTILSMYSCEENISILNQIAQVFGGILEERDSSGKCVMIEGLLNDHNGLPYFLKWAILNKKMEDEDDLPGLNSAVKEWQDRMRSYDVETF